MFILKYLNNRGISLIELLVGMVILLIVLAPLSNALSTTFNSIQLNIAQNSNISSEHEIFYAIAEEVRYATSLDTTIAGVLTYHVTIDVNGTPRDQSRKLYTQSEGNARTLIIEKTDVDDPAKKTINKVAARNLNNTDPLLFTWDFDTKTLKASIKLKNYYYTKSPNMNYNDYSIVLKNIKNM